VHFLPFQNQSLMPVVYRLGNVFVLPSQGPGETWGLALNEAMATGRAIIASSKVGGARDLILPGTNGWIFESGDRGALERALGQAADRGSA
jgi:glycosyltransferase involved in cell wall biosynthesis